MGIPGLGWRRWKGRACKQIFHGPSWHEKPLHARRAEERGRGGFPTSEIVVARRRRLLTGPVQNGLWCEC